VYYKTADKIQEKYHFLLIFSFFLLRSSQKNPMELILIAAMAKNRVIGKNNNIPWHIPEEMHHFKKSTMGHAVIMGRKTFESIDSNLPGRKIIVVSRKIKKYNKKNVFIVDSVIKGINLAKNSGEPELFIAGGATIFNKTLKFTDKIYLTKIENEFEGETFFPKIDTSDWKLLNSSQTFLENNLYFRFMIYQRHNFRHRRDDRDE